MTSTNEQDRAASSSTGGGADLRLVRRPHHDHGLLRGHRDRGDEHVPGGPQLRPRETYGTLGEHMRLFREICQVFLDEHIAGKENA